jgi:hypothetical protein
MGSSPRASWRRAGGRSSKPPVCRRLRCSIGMRPMALELGASGSRSASTSSSVGSPRSGGGGGRDEREGAGGTGGGPERPAGGMGLGREGSSIFASAASTTRLSATLVSSSKMSPRPWGIGGGGSSGRPSRQRFSMDRTLASAGSRFCACCRMGRARSKSLRRRSTSPRRRNPSWCSRSSFTTLTSSPCASFHSCTIMWARPSRSRPGRLSGWVDSPWRRTSMASRPRECCIKASPYCTKAVERGLSRKAAASLSRSPGTREKVPFPAA